MLFICYVWNMFVDGLDARVIRADWLGIRFSFVSKSWLLVTFVTYLLFRLVVSCFISFRQARDPFENPSRVCRARKHAYVTYVPAYAHAPTCAHNVRLRNGKRFSAHTPTHLSLPLSLSLYRAKCIRMCNSQWSVHVQFTCALAYLHLSGPEMGNQKWVSWNG